MSRSRSVLICAVLLAVVIGSGFSMTSVAAQNYVPGVRVGDWWKYSHPMGFWEAVSVQVTRVVDTHVYMTVTTSSSGSTMADVWVTDSRNPSDCLVIASGLNVGDPFALGSSMNVSSSAVRDYAGASRTVNIFNYSYSGTVYVYDRDTGVLCEFATTIGNEWYSNSILTETNMWGSNGLLVILLVVVVPLIVVPVVIVLVWRRKT